MNISGILENHRICDPADSKPSETLSVNYYCVTNGISRWERSNSKGSLKNRKQYIFILQTKQKVMVAISGGCIWSKVWDLKEQMLVFVKWICLSFNLLCAHSIVLGASFKTLLKEEEKIIIIVSYRVSLRSQVNFEKSTIFAKKK